MAEFQELIKNFDRIRDYMRQFFVYGFKSRGDYGEKSGRTYDNERRRIESWLGGYIQSGYTQKEKHVYISVDSKTIPQNPLYAAWKSKSFTDQDILLHFLLPDLLWNCPDGLSAGELCDLASAEYGLVFDSQTVRLKLKEYEKAGLFESTKKGKKLCYRLPDNPFPEASAWQALLTAVTYFQEAAPFGFIGSTILDHENAENTLFQFKHHFIVHTLEDGVLADILTAIKEHREILFENKSRRSGKCSPVRGIPLKILVSTQTGRRYLCLYLKERRRFNNFRLDAVTKVSLLEPCGFYEEAAQALSRNLPKCWGVSFDSGNRMDEICLKLSIDEEKEPYIINRLLREGRGGEVLKIRDQEYLYSASFFDTNEMLSWIKTFTGRILDIQGNNTFAIDKLTKDLELMDKMYCLSSGPASAAAVSRAESPKEARAFRNKTASNPGNVSDPETSCPDEKKPGRITGPESLRLFDKLYSCYYQAVRRILSEGAKAPISKNRIAELAAKYGYQESSLVIVPKLTGGEWPLLASLGPDGGFSSILRHPETLLPGRLPLTALQKSWLKAQLSDPRIRLFLTEPQYRDISAWLADTRPLYRQEDFCYFDQYRDGDEYGSPAYREQFQTILTAIREKKALILAYENRHGQVSTIEAAPYQLQYSGKDDKFRLCCLKYTGRAFRLNTLLNLSRVKACHLSRRQAPDCLDAFPFRPVSRCEEPVVIEISGERNSLERCMLHFANYEKHTCFLEETKTWKCSIYYDLADETELLIDILSFGPVIRVLGPEHFLAQIRERVRRQHDLLYGPVT